MGGVAVFNFVAIIAEDIIVISFMFKLKNVS